MSVLNLNGQREQRAMIKQIRERKRELTAEIADARREHERAVAAAEDGGSVVAVARALNNVRDLESELDDLKETDQRMTTGFAGGVANGNVELDASTLVAQYIDSEAQPVIREIAKGNAAFPQTLIGEIPGDVLARALRSGGIQAATGGITSPTPAMQVGPYQGEIPYPTAPRSFLAQIPAGTTGVATYPYSQEVVETDAGPDAVAPGMTKPPIGVGWQDVTTATTTYAGYFKLNRQTIEDTDTQGRATARSLVKLAQKLEAAALAADGTVSDAAGVTGVKGILNWTGIGSVDATGKVPVEAILTGIKTCLAAGTVPNVVVVDLDTWETLLTTKATGSGEYVSSPFLAGARQLWGVDFVPSLALGAHTAVVMDTSLLATLLYRYAGRILVGLDQDDLTKNRLTVVVETRVMMPVWAPVAACEVTNLGL